MKTIILPLLFLTSCGPALEESRISTTSKVESEKKQKTIKELQSFCRMIEPEVNPEYVAGEFCSSLKARSEKDPRYKSQYHATCIESDPVQLMPQLQEFYKTNYMSFIGNPELNEDAKTCIDLTAGFRIDIIVEVYSHSLEDNSNFSTRPFIPQPKMDESCWIMQDVTPNGCLVTQPCTGSEASSLSELPISSSALEDLETRFEDRLVPEGTKINLCNEKLSRVHKFKDPNDKMRGFNNPFFMGLTNASKSPSGPYGPANCHGTAQALVGNPLENLDVSNINFHSPFVEEQCGSQSRDIYDSAIGNASSVAARKLPLENGGFVINMNHDASCNEDYSGKHSFATYSCDEKDGGLITYVFTDQMCINNWGRQLQSAGLIHHNNDAELKPGCVMTQGDHSITLMMENNDMCYYYESAAPFAPAQLRTAPCRRLIENFDNYWCPEKPFQFYGENI